MSHKVLLVTEKPFATAAVTSIEEVFSAAGPNYELTKLENYDPKSDDLTNKLKEGGFEALIVRSDKMTPQVMEAAGSGLKLIVRAGAGVDTIDLEAASERNICVMNTPGQNSNAVAELAFGMMLTNARGRWGFGVNLMLANARGKGVLV